MKAEESVSFGAWRKQNELKNRINECSWFEIIPGMIIAVCMGLRSACTTGISAVIYAAVALLGAALFLIGGFCPLVLERPVRLLKKGLNLLGKTLLRLLLIPLYVLFLLFSLPYILQGKSKRGFYRWNESSDDLPSTAFLPFQEQNVLPRSASVLRSVNNVFYVFVKHRLLFLLPFTVVLLILGLIFFFVSSHSVFSFIYTIF